jgi:hypothetical protein
MSRNWINRRGRGCLLAIRAAKTRLGDPPVRKVDYPLLYSNGALLHGRELIIPYAMSDSASSFARVSLDELLAAME